MDKKRFKIKNAQPLLIRFKQELQFMGCRVEPSLDDIDQQYQSINAFELIFGYKYTDGRLILAVRTEDFARIKPHLATVYSIDETSLLNFLKEVAEHYDLTDLLNRETW